MRLRVLVIAALVALTVPSAAVAARTAKPHRASHGQGTGLNGTWAVKVSVTGQQPFPALLTFTPGGGLVETESDAPGTGLGAWKAIGPNRYAYSFTTFIFTATGDPGGRAVVRGEISRSGGTLSGPFKFDVLDPADHVVQSGSGTATATRYVIPPL